MLEYLLLCRNPSPKAQTHHPSLKIPGRKVYRVICYNLVFLLGVFISKPLRNLQLTNQRKINPNRSIKRRPDTSSLDNMIFNRAKIKACSKAKGPPNA
jgi:hypothetical protein